MSPGSHTSPCMYIRVVTYTHVQTCPQSAAKAHTYMNTLGLLLPHPLPPPVKATTTARLALSSLPLHGSSLAEGVARGAKSPERARLLRAHCNSSWVSS